MDSCVMTMVDKPKCLALKASFTNSLVLFLTSYKLAQSSRIIKLLVLFCKLGNTLEVDVHVVLITWDCKNVRIVLKLPFLICCVIFEN